MEEKQMTAKQVISMALAYCGISQNELARRLGWSAQLLSKRMQVGKFTVEEWEHIGEAIGAKTKITFTFDDGTIV